MTDASSALPHGNGALATINGELEVGGVPLGRLTARVGQTPYYAYDRRLISDRVASLRATLPRRLRLHYAMKANPMPALVAHLVGEVDGVDVASGGELRVALDAGADPREVSFAGPAKSDAELRQAVASGVLVNVESARELRPLVDASDALGVAARVAIRINPDFELKSAGMKMGGGPKQFGVDAELVPQMLRTIGSMGLAFEGFHIYAGSQNLQADAISSAQEQAFELAVRLSADAPSSPRILNLGGGFGIPYFPGERPLDLDRVGAALSQICDRAATILPSASIVLELGRFLVGEAGLYVCRVIERKVSRGSVFLVTDGGLHHHLAASGNFGQVLRKNFPVTIQTASRSQSLERVTVVGPLCTPLDCLAERMLLPEADVGDLVVVFNSGAYGATASPQGFLSHPAVVEVLV